MSKQVRFVSRRSVSLQALISVAVTRRSKGDDQPERQHLPQGLPSKDGREDSLQQSGDA